ncbi:MAG: hypothetical protein ACOWWM_10780 [Desulfobacterales bacterium]
MHRIKRWISFDQKDYDLLKIVNEVANRERSYKHLKQEFYPYFHPQGIKELAETRGLRIAYTVISLLTSLEIGKVSDRLSALRTLRDEVMSTAEGTLRTNTARVLVQIMKELVRARGDDERQLELAHDFRVTAAGNPRKVREQLRRHYLLEMPEDGNQIAFDDHVHDANTKGRKSPTHLIMDAWIKGIRRLTVIYYNFVEARVIAELLEAAAIMGITVQIGIEFSARHRDRYAQLIWTPMGFRDVQDYLCFLAEPEVIAFFQKGRGVSAFQQRYVMAVLEKYNSKIRHDLADRFGITFEAVGKKAFREFVGTGQASLLHLSKFLHNGVLEAMRKEIGRLRQAYPEADEEEQRRMEERVEAMNVFDSDTLKSEYLWPENNPEIHDPGKPSDHEDTPELLKLRPEEVLDRLMHLPATGSITLNLSNLRAEDVLEILYNCEGRISRLELFNLKDFASGRTDHLPDIERLMQALNSGSVIALKRVVQTLIDSVESRESHDRDDRIRSMIGILHDLYTMGSYYKAAPLTTMIGSDSTGRSPMVHGMGLALLETLPKRTQRRVRRGAGQTSNLFPVRMSVHRRVTYEPRSGHTPTARRWHSWCRHTPGFRGLGFARKIDWLTQEHTTTLTEYANVVALGGVQEERTNGLRLEPSTSLKRKSPFAWRYLNSSLRNIMKVLVGFIPAFLAFYLTKDWWFLAWFGAFIWFAITGFRNILQSVIGGGGIRRSPLLRWGDYVSWSRISDSLMWTGFSVPLLDYLVKTALLDQTFGITAGSDPVALYAFIGLANGIYLSSHNILRGFPRTAVVGNFFRSILSIPVAIALSSLIGTLLAAAGYTEVAVILQKWAAVISKAASDTVAGFIEGAADRQTNIGMRFRDYRSRLSLLFNTYSQLELLFPETQVLELLEAQETVQPASSSEAKDLEKILIIITLDLLYFWMYKPRSRSAFRSLLWSLSREERRILIGTHGLLLRQKQVSQMFIDGIVGRHFSKALAFYLDRAPEYLDAVQVISYRVGDSGESASFDQGPSYRWDTIGGLAKSKVQIRCALHTTEDQ